MAELLLELLSEEIPARMQDPARAELRELFVRQAAQDRLTFDRLETFVTPRRLVLRVGGLPERQPGYREARYGPRRGAPDKAIEGFKRSLQGLTHSPPEWREERGVEKLYTEIHHEGLVTAELLADRLPALLGRLPWPKSMRWGEGEARWVRPLHAILCLLDGEVVPFRFAGIASGDRTRGHSFMALESFRASGFDDYVRKLREAKVVLDGEERRRLIAEGAAGLALGEDLVLEDDPALLDELKGLVEWPVPLMGRIDEAFMDVPPEVLVTTMRQNQRYLALRRRDGSLAPRFVVVANVEADDGGRAIVAGNERVLRARLWDARFFWEQDKKVPLESRLPALEKIVFHAELGSLGERVERLVGLAGALVAYVSDADRILAERAALLCKADLVSGMVGEFPELQGVMGAHYARAQGEPEAVARAIGEHYAPKGPDDRCPTAPESVVVALADKLDALVGFFAKGIRPTGSKDPFALRRAALGVVRLVLENGLRLPLRRAFAAARAGYGDRLGGTDGEALARELLAFFADRLKVHLRGAGVRHDLIAAVFRAGEDDDLVRLLARVRTLATFLGTEDGANLLAGYRRAANIVAIEEKKDKVSYAGEPSPELLSQEEERVLFGALKIARERIEAALAREDFAGAMSELAELRRPIDEFFDRVMVNVDDPGTRGNRLRLLSRIRAALGAVADFSLIEDVSKAAA